MTPEARRMLDQIDEFLSRRDIASAEVAAVLTALRSNDMEVQVKNAETNKLNTTCKIRSAALPKSCPPSDWFGSRDVNVGTGLRSRALSPACKDADLTFIAVPNSWEFRDDVHYWDHLVLAANALGIKVRGVESK